MFIYIAGSEWSGNANATSVKRKHSIAEMSKLQLVAKRLESVMKHPSAIDRHVGQRLQQLRLARGMDLPGLSGLIGISAPRLLQFEEGRERISADLIRRLSKILNVSPSEFFSGFSRSGANGTEAVAENGIFGEAQGEEQRLLRDFGRVRDAKNRELILVLVAAYAEFSDLDQSRTPSGH
jgi:transcriptional regulator with XRE-family HTH domain